MLDAFLTYINEQSLFKPTEKILLAISGGKDSVVLLDLFMKAKFDFAVAHCNFQLRGEDSDQDALFIQQLCQQAEVPFYSTTFETTEFAKTHKLSIEMTARQLRYEWFEQIRQQSGCQYIATAHHINDSIETILLNLSRGTGIAGIRGILPHHNYIIRPLLFASRTSIEEYITDYQLSWREDSSNASTEYQRNLIRHKVVPMLKQINPNLEQTFARNTERMQALEQIFLNSLVVFRKAVIHSDGSTLFFNISAIKSQTSAAYLLEETLKEFGFNYFQSKDIYLSLEKESGKTFHSASHTLTKDREYLILHPKVEISKEELLIERNTSVVEYHGLRFEIALVTPADWQALSGTDKSNCLLWIDAEKITFPLSIRRWQEGDWFVPLGMKGRKKVSDFLIDKKVPLPQKKEVFVLTSAGEVVWLIGHRADDRFKITPDTRQVLKLSLL